MPRRLGLVIVFAVACTRAPAGGSPEPSVQSAPPSSAPVPQPTSSLTASTAPSATLSPPEPRPVIESGGKRAVRAEHGLVTSVEPLATRAGVRMLEAGGNAVDAAVAVAYALAVTHPSAGNVGGGGFMLVRPPGGPTIALDFREAAPQALTRAKFRAMIAEGGSGPASVGVPGTVAGLNLAHERFGSLPLATLLEPAIELARRGHVIGTREALAIGWNWQKLKRDADARATFGQGGKPRRAGSRLVRADLARTLQRIAQHGNAGFYAGSTATALVGALAPDGLMTLKDLSTYTARVREPLRFDYRGYVVEVMPPPSAGGVAVTQTLLMLAALRAHELRADPAAELHLFLEASRRAQAERQTRVTDPDRLETNEQAARRRQWLDPFFLLRQPPAIDRSRASSSEEIQSRRSSATTESEETTHFSVVDAHGMVVSCTTTLSAGFGAKLVARGTGVVLNNSVGAFANSGDNSPEGGRRTTSSMAPTLVLATSQPVLVLGSPGGNTIPSTIVQVLRNVIDHGMTIDAAVDAPRLHQSYLPDEFRYEGARPIPDAILRELVTRGHTVSKTRIPIGDANDILIANGIAYGYADPREGGLALAAHAQPPP